MELRELNDLLSAHAEEVCRELLSNGTKRGHEWVVGSVGNERGESMSVSLDGPKAGLWYDHATKQGGDLLELVRLCLNFPGIGPAAKWARDYLGLPDDRNRPAKKFNPLEKGFKRREDTEWQHGVAAWCYHDEDGKPDAYAVRFDRLNDEGKVVKDVLPLRFTPPDNGVPDRENRDQWRWRGWKEPERPPIYNLHLLKRRPDAPVLVVEGEKTADAAARLFPSHVVVTWQGGCARVMRVDLTPLRGRDVVLWPDADAAGRKAMNYLAAALKSPQVRLPDTLPDGWDLADPVPDGISVEGILASAATPPPGPSTPTPPPKSEPLAIVYDRTAGRYLGRSPTGEWNPLTVSAAETLLSPHFDQFKDESGTSALDRHMASLQINSTLTYCGPLSGHRAGFLDDSVLITTHCPAFPGVPGDCQRVLNFVFNLLAQDEHQYWRFLFWLKLRREAIRLQRWRAGHALVLVGPRNCGKSLLQSRIITPLLGGRAARPYPVMRGKRDFNGELFGAEHLIIDDESPARDMDSRREFGNNIKSMLFQPTQACHPKGRQAVTLRPIWALSCCLNDEPENLMVLPPMESSMVDKWIILRCLNNKLPLTGGRTSEWDEFDDILNTELPAFADFVDALVIPEALTEPRTGLLHYQHPTILEELSSESPEAKVDELICDVLLNGDPPALSWTGSASDLEDALYNSKRSRDARHVIANSSRLGVYLNRLKQQQPDRYDYARDGRRRQWTIKR